jgi:uncharacterized ion transporter superfamily protein YfcC
MVDIIILFNIYLKRIKIFYLEFYVNTVKKNFKKNIVSSIIQNNNNKKEKRKLHKK